MIAENLPEIIAIFQEQNPLRPPGHFVRGSLNFESHDLRRIGIESWWLWTHSRKPMSRTGALRRPAAIRRSGEILNQPALRRKPLTMHDEDPRGKVPAFVELVVVDQLRNRGLTRRPGGKPEEAFDVVIPSMPGDGFSGTGPAVRDDDRQLVSDPLIG